MLPNFFVVGAAKCATTTLHQLLAQHPEIVMSTVKEPCFFTDYGSRTWQGPGAREFMAACISDRGAYEALFEAKPGAWLRGESTTSYLDEPQSVDRILTLCGPETKIVAMVRNPVQRAYSEYMFTVRDGWETQPFLESLKREPERIDEGWVPHFRHVRRGLYGERLAGFRDAFGRQRLLCLKYPDFVEKPEAVWLQILDFLGAAHTPLPDQTELNRSGVPRSRSLHNVMSQKNWLKSGMKAVLPENLRAKLRHEIETRNLKRVRMTKEEEGIARAYFLEADKAMQSAFGFSVLEMPQ